MKLSNLFILCLLALLPIAFYLGSQQQAAFAPAQTTSAETTAFEAEVKQELAQIDTHLANVDTLSKQALAIRASILQGDTDTANQKLSAILENSPLRPLGGSPFAVLISSLIPENDPAFLAALDSWISQHADQAMPFFLRASYELDHGWAVRGHGWGKNVPPDAMEQFVSLTGKAASDVDTALQLNPDNPFAHELKLRILHTSPERMKGFDAAFAEATRKWPDYYPFHQIRLRAYSPYWYGDLDTIYRLTQASVENAPADSPLRMLYLDFYTWLVRAVANACDRQYEAACITAAINADDARMETVQKGVDLAIGLYTHADHYSYGLAIREAIGTISRIRGADQVTNELIQKLATVTGSNTNLVDNHPGKNYYPLDLITASMWQEQDHTANTVQKLGEALLDMKNITFPDKDAEARAVAEVYDIFGTVYANAHQRAKAMAYLRAAAMLGGDNFGENQSNRCFIYYDMRDFASAVTECSRLLQNKYDLDVLFWRGWSYHRLGQLDEAEKDDLEVVHSQSPWRYRAATELSVIYGTRNQFQAMLDILSLPFLYAGGNDREGLAVSYNNRCYALMKLERLQEALDDCNRSLQYGTIPDAVQKQQELRRRLQANEKPL